MNFFQSSDDMEDTDIHALVLEKLYRVLDYSKHKVVELMKKRSVSTCFSLLAKDGKCLWLCEISSILFLQHTFLTKILSQMNLCLRWICLHWCVIAKQLLSLKPVCLLSMLVLNTVIETKLILVFTNIYLV